MKFSESKSTSAAADKGKRRIRLASLITVSITSLVIVSVLSISTILYYNLNRSLTREFKEKVEAEGRETGQALNNRISRAHGRLKTLSLDNTVRVTLMLEANQQLEEYLASIYSDANDLHFFVADEQLINIFSATRHHFAPELVKELLTNDQSTARLQYHDEHGFLYTFTQPVKRRRETIGLAASVYQLNKDEYLRDILVNKDSADLVIVRDGSIKSLLSGREVAKSTDNTLNPATSAAYQVARINSQNFAVVPEPLFDNLFYIADTSALDASRRQVLDSLLFPAAIIITLALIVSTLISNRITTPLQRLADLALNIAAGRKATTTLSGESRIVEFRNLNDSLTTMLSHLENARELERYQKLFDGVADIVIIHNLDGDIIKANRVALKRLQHEEKPLIGQHIADLVATDEPKRIFDRYVARTREKTENIFTIRIIDSSGSPFPVECHARTIIYGGHEVILNVIRDISDRKAAETALKESHHTLKTVLDSIDATIYVCDVTSQSLLFMNKQMIETYGANADNKKCHEFFKRSSTRCDNCSTVALMKDAPDFEETLTREFFNPIIDKWFISSDRLIRWVDGRLAKFQIAFDITETKQLETKREQAEAQLRRAQKMEAIATLAGGVAHDLNNILSGIVSFPDVMLLQTPEDSPMRQPLLTMKDSGLRASAIVQDLLTLARRGVVREEVVNLNDIIITYLKSPEHKRLMEEHPDISIELDLQENLFNIIGSSLHLSKTLMNLLANSADAIAREGTIRITTSSTIIDEQGAFSSDMKGGEFVVLTIEDDGCGIPEEDQQRVYEPFFTTKSMGRSGTGLGMAVVWGTVEDHEGKIFLQSEPGKGTLFSLYFPLTRKKLLKEQMVFSKNSCKGNGETILVIDDIAELRDVASLMFTQLGYTVVTASSGEEAIDYLRDNYADLLLLDMIMEGGMNGLETYRKILEIHPGQKAIITTGYSEIDIVKQALELGAGQYIKKPYLFDEIAKAVAVELDKP